MTTLGRMRAFAFFRETRATQTPITLSLWFNQKILGYNRYVYWPVHSSSIVTGWQNIWAGVETCPGYMPGCYIQGLGRIRIGNYTQISANVGIISSNHDVYDNRIHVKNEVNIGEYCWLGMGVVVLPGVELGDFTVVGAGAIVTKSFQEGYCVVAGNPARVIRKLDPAKCLRHKSEVEYHGYVKACNFESFCKKHLRV